MGRNARNVPVCVGLHSVLWRAGPPGAYKRQRRPPSLTQLFPPRRGSQSHSSSDPRRPTSSRRQLLQPSQPAPDATARSVQTPTSAQSSCPGSGRASRRLCAPPCVLPPRPDHARLRRRSRPPRLGAPRPLRPGKLLDRREGQREGRASWDPETDRPPLPPRSPPPARTAARSVSAQPNRCRAAQRA